MPARNAPELAAGRLLVQVSRDGSLNNAERHNSILIFVRREWIKRGDGAAGAVTVGKLALSAKMSAAV